MGKAGVVNLDARVLESIGWKRSPPPPPPDLMSFSPECLSAAEEAAEKVVDCVRPTLDTEETRCDIIDYIQRLIKAHTGCEVFPFGSVPLKTFLPDGDIDLTVFRGPNSEEVLALDVLAVLQAEEQNQKAEYQVKDIQFIDAEVKLVKCLVRDKVIDISFSQLGGLSTLCFLEQVDRIVGRNHLFKRSIILVKTWCYFESRVLGANHGLISTYALETLVLCIFHLFHSSIRGPLSVLYKFLEYYSQFDWENHCIGLKGPVCRSSLPDIVVRLPEGGWDDFLLSDEYLENCMEMFSLPLRGLNEKPRSFQVKYLNIIDPLKENNNLGRSVCIGNFYRIRSAFKYGARKLGQVLSRPRDKIAEEVSAFFANTISRHGSSIQQLAPKSCNEESLEVVSSSHVELFSKDASDIVHDRVGMKESSTLTMKNKPDIYFKKEVSSEMLSLKSSAENGNFTQKLAFNPWLGNSQAVCVTHSGFRFPPPEANNLEMLSLDFMQMDLLSIEEPEQFNHLADLTGAYDSHIRSLLYGQLCHGVPLFELQMCYPQSLPSMIQYMNPRGDIVIPESVPLMQNHFNEMNSQVVFMKQGLYPPPADFSLPAPADFCLPPHADFSLPPHADFSLPRHADFSLPPHADFSLPPPAIRAEWRPKAQGTSSYIPAMNGSYRGGHLQGRGAHWQGRDRIKEQRNQNQYHTYGRGHMDGVHFDSYETNCSANREVYPARDRRFQGRGKYDRQGQSHNSVGNETFKTEIGSVENRAEEAISSLDQIEFGSVGNLAHDLNSGRASASGSVPDAAVHETKTKSRKRK